MEMMMMMMREVVVSMTNIGRIEFAKQNNAS